MDLVSNHYPRLDQAHIYFVTLGFAIIYLKI